ncbi:MAG TPA: hypothetical protein H9741_08305 [Candidatus Borkfalkia faecipullorum]|uniref:Uncharacterized protein n=1 Tax=Candidatus Borkfalkia faecipullorum TaxID=2838510 RepID=A0A9D2AH14_9FIRM|nr:hypothetical protein [Candidatus Borkfalkia faecipullorum]
MFRKILLVCALAVCLIAVLLIAMTCENIPRSRIRSYTQPPRSIPVRLLGQENASAFCGGAEIIRYTD